MKLPERCYFERLMSVPLEPDKRQRDQLNEAVLSYLDTWYERVSQMPAIGRDIDSESMDHLGRPPGEQGRSIQAIIDDLEVAGKPGLLHPSGGHMSYIPGAGLYSGALADLLASGLNRYTGVVGTAPGMSAIEHGVVRWMHSLFDLGEKAAGCLLSGGSMANFTGIVAARTARLGDNFGNGVMYVTPHAHHSVTKAAHLAGIGDRQIRPVPVDQDLTMVPAALLAAINKDRGAGLDPFLVVASAGTTDTGTVDPLAAIGEVARNEGLWLHIDAAYGGFFMLTERGRRALPGISLGDSISLDPHKGLSIPYGVGALLVGDEAHLIDANRGRGSYLVDEDHYMGLRDISSLAPELSRPNRGLQVWLPLHLHGVAAFREALDSSLDLAELAYDRLTGLDGLETPWKPDLSIVAFRFQDDAVGQLALDAIRRDRTVHLSPTTIDGRFVLRFAILNRRSTADQVHHAIDIIEKVLTA